MSGQQLTQWLSAPVAPWLIQYSSQIIQGDAVIFWLF